jgi:4-amino-4-deoxy-L-arabinose transferase-like glycosyltransferase
MKVMDREWREAADLRPSHVGLTLALIAAALLRFWTLGHGVPYMLGVDEPEVMDRAIRMIQTGDFNPHFYDYPSLYLYVQAAVAVARFLFGAVRGEFSSLAGAATTDFYLWGRAVTAIIGTATVFLLHLAGLRWGARTALLAAALLAVMPLHVRESHFILTDVPVTFLVTLTFVLSLGAHERSTPGSFVAAGAAAGLAAATKYNGGLAIVMPLIACWMTLSVRPSRLTVSLAVVGASLGCFLLAAPYTFLDLPTFLNQFAHLAAAYHGPAAPGSSISVVYLKHLRNAWHWPATLMIVGGLILGLVRTIRGPGRVKWTLLLAFPLLYFWFVSRQHIVFARYLLPIVPFLSLMAAAAVVSGVSLLRRYEIPRQVRSALIVALVLLAIAPPSYTSVGYDMDASKTWTTKQAYDWITQQVPRGSSITIESQELLLPAASYKVDHVKQLRATPLDGYAAAGTQYLVASSECYGPYFASPHAYPDAYADYVRLFRGAREMVRFTPSREHPGPELRVLKVTP